MPLSGRPSSVSAPPTFRKNSGRSELRLVYVLRWDALADAGLSPTESTRLTTFTMDTNTEMPWRVRPARRADRSFQDPLRRWRRMCDRAARRVMAVAIKLTSWWRIAFNERSGMRFGQVQTRFDRRMTPPARHLPYPHGALHARRAVAMIARRYMHLSGATSRLAVPADQSMPPTTPRYLRQADNH